MKICTIHVQSMEQSKFAINNKKRDFIRHTFQYHHHMYKQISVTIYELNRKILKPVLSKIYIIEIGTLSLTLV